MANIQVKSNNPVLIGEITRKEVGLNIHFGVQTLNNPLPTCHQEPILITFLEPKVLHQVKFGQQPSVACTMSLFEKYFDFRT